MKSNTPIHIGIRNVGVQDSPQFFAGGVTESLMWLATQIGRVHMKNGLKIYIGRTQEAVMAGLDLKRGISTSVELELAAMLATVIPDGTDDDDESTERNATGNLVDPEDTYRG